jgi:predicted transcriptional regulator
MDQKAIANKLHITQQAVSKQIDAAGWMIVTDNITYFKSIVLGTSISIKAKK